MHGREPSLVDQGGGDQDNSGNQRGGMEFQQFRQDLCLAAIVMDRICRQPKFAQPDIEQQNRDEPREVENVLLNGYTMAQGGSENSQRGPRVRKTEKPLRDDYIQKAPNRNQYADCPPEGTLRDCQPRAGQEPGGDHNDGHGKQQQGPRVSVRGGIRQNLERARRSYRMQCDG